MKANKPKAPKMNVETFNTMEFHEGKNYVTADGVKCNLVPVGTYVSKSAYQTRVAKLKKLAEMWYGKYQKWKGEAIQYQDKFIELSESNTRWHNGNDERVRKIIDDSLDLNSRLQSENSELKSSFSQLAEENKELKKDVINLDAYQSACDSKDRIIREMEVEIGTLNRMFETKNQIIFEMKNDFREEQKIAKFNFLWAMIASAGFITYFLLYILTK